MNINKHMNMNIHINIHTHDHARKVLPYKPQGIPVSLPAGLQLEAFWRRNYPIILGCVALLMVMFLWRFMYRVASVFISFSETMAKYGFLALSAALVSFAVSTSPPAIYHLLPLVLDAV